MYWQYLYKTYAYTINMVNKNSSKIITQSGDDAIIIDINKFKNGTCKITTLSKEKVAVCKSNNKIRIYPIEKNK